MNECKQNRKPITWLLLGTLDAKDATALRAHLKDCAGCREFFEKSRGILNKLAVAGPNPAMQAPPDFHRFLLERLRATQPRPAWQEVMAGLGRLMMTPRVAIPALAILLVGGLLVIQNKPAMTVSSMKPSPAPVAVPMAVNDPAPTAVNYQLAAAQSLSKLDELLTREGNESLPPAPVYTASTKLPDNAF